MNDLDGLRAVFDSAIAADEPLVIVYQYRTSSTPSSVKGRITWQDTRTPPTRIEVQMAVESPDSAPMYSGYVIDRRGPTPGFARYRIEMASVHRVTKPDTQEVLWEKGARVPVADYLYAVVDKASFYAFVAALIEDYVDPSPAEQWENRGFVNCLDASLACAEARIDRPDGPTDRLPEDPSWSSFASFLYYAKWYE